MDHLKAVGGEVFYQDGVYTARIEYLSDDEEKRIYWSCACSDPEELQAEIEEEISTRQGIKRASLLVLQSMIEEFQEFVAEVEASEDMRRKAWLN